MKIKLVTELKGGQGSGNFNHAGIPGHQGGSQSSGVNTPSWDMKKSSAVLTVGRVEAEAQWRQDGPRKFVEIVYSDTENADSTIYWDVEEFEGPTAMADAMHRAESRMAEFNDKFAHPKKKARTKKPKGPGESYSIYD